MLELGSSGSVRGVSSNGHPYRDPRPFPAIARPHTTGQPKRQAMIAAPIEPDSAPISPPASAITVASVRLSEAFCSNSSERKIKSIRARERSACSNSACETPLSEPCHCRAARDRGGSRSSELTTPPPRNRWFADSPLEGNGFEPSAPSMESSFSAALGASVAANLHPYTAPFAPLRRRVLQLLTAGLVRLAAALVQAAPLPPAKFPAAELTTAPSLELVRDGCGPGWHRHHWRDYWGRWHWGQRVPN
jgi:hypothetical protein